MSGGEGEKRGDGGGWREEKGGTMNGGKGGGGGGGSQPVAHYEGVCRGDMRARGVRHAL